MSNYTMLERARAQLIIQQPFFASIMLGMPMTESKQVPTLATNGKEILYNPEYLATLTPGETEFAVAHEVMHCVFQHMYRVGARDKFKYNVAADYVINDLLVKEGVGTINPAWLNDPKLVAKGGGTTEGVYDLLPKNMKPKGKGNGAGEKGGPQDWCEAFDGMSEDEKAAAEADMKIRVIQAANVAKMMGRLSAGLERLVNDLKASKIDWKAVLRRFLSERAKVDWSYARPKRRWLADDINLPSLTGEQLGEIYIAVDCSGSIDDAVLQRFGGEIRAIIEDTSPSRVHVGYFDAKMLRHDTFERGTDFFIKAAGGGGTAFGPIWPYATKHGFQPMACIVLTDLCCSDFGTAPPYPVLWCSTEAGTAPFGEILHMKGE